MSMEVLNPNVAKYNETLIKQGQGGSSFQIKDKDDLKKQYQNFMMLLMAQLKHQDPMEPVKNEEFVTQLVQFALVEQSLRSNETQDKALEEDRTARLMAASNHIGKEVEVESNQFEHTENVESKLGYEIPKGASSAQLMISDEKGTLVGVYDIEKTQGKHMFVWDGLSKTDRQAPYQVAGGQYKFEVIVKDEHGKPMKGDKNQIYKVPTSVYSIVQGAMRDNGTPKIKTGKTIPPIPLESILSIQSV